MRPLRLSLTAPAMVGDRVTTDLAHPAVERCLCAIGVEAFEGFAEGLLNDLACGVVIAV